MGSNGIYLKGQKYGNKRIQQVETIKNLIEGEKERSLIDSSEEIIINYLSGNVSETNLFNVFYHKARQEGSNEKEALQIALKITLLCAFVRNNQSVNPEREDVKKLIDNINKGNFNEVFSLGNNYNIFFFSGGKESALILSKSFKDIINRKYGEQKVQDILGIKVSIWLDDRNGERIMKSIEELAKQLIDNIRNYYGLTNVNDAIITDWAINRIFDRGGSNTPIPKTNLYGNKNWNKEKNDVGEACVIAQMMNVITTSCMISMVSMAENAENGGGAVGTSSNDIIIEIHLEDILEKVANNVVTMHEQHDSSYDRNDEKIGETKTSKHPSELPMLNERSNQNDNLRRKLRSPIKGENQSYVEKNKHEVEALGVATEMLGNAFAIPKDESGKFIQPNEEITIKTSHYVFVATDIKESVEKLNAIKSNLYDPEFMKKFIEGDIDGAIDYAVKTYREWKAENLNNTNDISGDEISDSIKNQEGRRAREKSRMEKAEREKQEEQKNAEDASKVAYIEKKKEEELES